MIDVRDLKLFDMETGDLCPYFVAAGILPPDQFGIRRTVSGKGLSQEEARRKCRFEACERSAAIFPLPGQYRSVWRAYNKVRDSAVDPRDLIQLSEKQYADREKWNSTTAQEFHFPNRFDPDMAIEWVPATDLPDKEDVLVPAAWVYLGYQNPSGYGFPQADSNGLASGDTLDDAIENACLELTERDAVSIWWYNALPKPLLPVGGQLSGLVDDFGYWAKSRGRDFWLLDLTSDLAVPVCAAVTYDKDRTGFSIGFGAGWTNEEAACSAMGELVQFEISKKLMKNIHETNRYHLISILTKPDARMMSYLLPAAEAQGPRRKLKAGDMKSLLTALRIKGLKPYLYRYNGTGAPTVRVIIPGLRSLWPRFASGRLYDVPWESGEVSVRKMESELNPVPILY